MHPPRHRQTPEPEFTSLPNWLLDNITGRLDVLSTNGDLQYILTPLMTFRQCLMTQVSFPCSASCALPSNPTLNISFPSIYLVIVFHTHLCICRLLSNHYSLFAYACLQLPFLVNALLTSQQVVMPFLYIIEFIIKL